MPIEEQASKIAKAIHVIRAEPGALALIGLILGLFTRELVELASIFNAWIRKILLGDRRSK